MLQGRPGEACPAGSLSLALRQDSSAQPQPQPSQPQPQLSQLQQQGLALLPSADMELPHDMARQALAATGGKSNLMATKWLLERRAEVVQQHIETDLVSELGQQRKGCNGADALKKPRTDEDLGSLLPSPQALWGNSNLHTADMVAPFPAGAAAGAPVGVERSTIGDKRPTPSSKDWLGSSGVLERHASTGSTSAFPREDMGEAQLQLKLQPVAELQQPAKASKVSRSPEPEDAGKGSTVKLASRPTMTTTTTTTTTAAAAAAMQDAHNTLKRKWQDEVDTASPLVPSTLPPITMGVKQQSPSSGKTLASLAERMRPNSISEILGQEHLLGPHCILRSLLDVESLPCIVFGGPPGTGKTSLARLIARSASCRFVAFPSAKGVCTEIQEILDEAKQARKFGQRTVMFVETLSRFSKPQQECLLPAVEAGYVVFIGATTENPSVELIPSLLSRCRVVALKKLQPDHLCIAMRRAISDHERGVLVSMRDFSGIELLAIEDDVIQYLATAADGDARVALNALEAAVYIALSKVKHKRKLEIDGKGQAPGEGEDLSFKGPVDRDKPIGNTAIGRRDTPHNVLEHLKGYFQFSQEEYAKPFKKIVAGKDVSYGVTRDREAPKLSSDVEEGAAVRDRELTDRKAGGELVRNTSFPEDETTLVVTMVDAKEAFQWPQLVVEKIQEESDTDLMPALLKSIKGGDSNAAVYWLARVLEKNDCYSKVAESLMKFASEEIGMADPQALVQAVACYQACQLLGMKSCTSYLTQCVVYLSMAPKSDALPQAFMLAQKVIQDGQNESVPLHLRSASGGFTKESGYLPIALRNFTFLKWPEQH